MEHRYGHWTIRRRWLFDQWVWVATSPLTICGLPVTHVDGTWAGVCEQVAADAGQPWDLRSFRPVAVYRNEWGYHEVATASQATIDARLGAYPYGSAACPQ